MYPSSNNNASFFGNYNNDNYHSETPQDLYNSPSFSTFHFPSPLYIPLEDEAVFFEFFQQQQFVLNDHKHPNTFNLELEMPSMESTMEEYSNNNELIAMKDGDDDHCDFNTRVDPENSSPRKRLSKGDRHSKINTARGPRDRRMRLSLDVAKKLFGLQDLLGFDKASKTVDWLLTKSKTAILELIQDKSGSFMDVSNSASSTSDCEVMSGTADGFTVLTGDDDQAINKSKSSCGSSKKQKEKVVRVRNCADFHHPLAKASRERARERARERTIEKRNNIHGGGRDYFVDQATNEYANQLGSWSTLQENQHQITGNWTLSHGFSYQHEHQFNELQKNVKAWKGHNN